VAGMGLRLPSLASSGALGALFLLASACGPQVDHAAEADLERHLGQITTNEQTFPPSESFSPMALVVGQWTEHRITDERGRKSLITNKLVGQEAGAYWFEVVNESAYGRDAAKLLVAMSGGREPSSMEIRALRVKKGDAQPVEVDPAAQPEVRAKYRAALDLFAMSVEGDDKDDVRVPGGHFIGCYRVETAGAWGPWPVPVEVCTHPSVPLSGVVRASPVGKTGLMELVAFGVTGAEGEM
jgi:hypothetical protein